MLSHLGLKLDFIAQDICHLASLICLASAAAVVYLLYLSDYCLILKHSDKKFSSNNISKKSEF